MPELPADMTSLSVSEWNYWNSNPVGGVRFEMKLLPPMAIGVADLVAEVVFSVSYGAARAVPAPAKVEVPTSPRLRQLGGRSGRRGGKRLFRQPDSSSDGPRSTLWVFFSRFL